MAATGASDESRLNILLVRKRNLLEEQAEASRELNRWLTAKGDGNNDKDGAIENSKKTTKNLEAAIVQARQPGYFEYHRKSKMVRRMEKRGVVKKLTDRIARLQEQLDLVRAEIEAYHAEHRRKIEEQEVPSVSGLKGWFERYGEPSPALRQINGFASEFVPNSKVYGGTAHYKAFKSVAVTLKKGRMTR